jgi:hypothetical protein
MNRHHFTRDRIIAGVIGSGAVAIFFAILSWTVWR